MVGVKVLNTAYTVHSTVRSIAATAHLGRVKSLKAVLGPKQNQGIWLPKSRIVMCLQRLPSKRSGISSEKERSYAFKTTSYAFAWLYAHLINAD
jgi:hypothetical protein